MARRFAIFLATCALVALSLGVSPVLAVHIPGPAPVGPPIGSYTIYGRDGVFIGVGSDINGLVGAQDSLLATVATEAFGLVGLPLAATTGRSIALNGTAQITGDARSGQNTVLANNAQISGTLTRNFGSVLTLGSSATVGTDSEYDSVDFPSLPPATTFPCPAGGPDQGSGSNSITVTLGPGTYGALRTGGNSIINLTGAGNYFFDSIQTANGVAWNLVAGVNVFVCQDMNLGALNDILPTSLTAADVSWEVHSTDTHNAYKCGAGCDWIGDVFAPNGGIHLGAGQGPTSFKGSLHGLFVDIEHDVDGTGPTPPPPPTTHLTLVKAVVNTGGGTAVAGDWNLAAAGPTPLSGAGNSAAVTNQAVNPGTYTLTEGGGPVSYSASAWVCTGANASTPTSVTLVAGDNATCTITNTFIPTHLTLHKTVVNTGGGTAVAGDFTLQALGGPTPFSGPGNTPAVTSVLVGPGTYDLHESGRNTDYSPGVWICTGASASTTNSATLVAGNDATCTITNTFIPTHLTLVKSVVNTGGGTAVPGDWTLSANGPTPINGAGNSAAVTNVLVGPGIYILAESGGPVNYSASTWVCNGAAGSTPSTVTLVRGDTATCTITNTFAPTHLTLVKDVVNTGGGTAVPGDWNLAAAGPTAISGSGNSPAVTNQLVDPGTYLLLESGGPADYSASGWSCTGTTRANPTIVTLVAGDDVTCTITNTFVPPVQQTHLSLVKVVSGGTAAATDWTLSATGPTSINGISGSGTVTNAVVTAGTYTLSESGGPVGYSAGAWACTGASGSTSTTVTLVAGDSATCTITNTHSVSPAQTLLTLVKQVVNTGGGTATATDWTLSAAGPTPISGTSGSPAVSAVLVSPGTYVLSESAGPAGYTAGAWSCSGGPLAGTTLTLSTGDNATCTIVNTYVAPVPPSTSPTPTASPSGSVSPTSSASSAPTGSAGGVTSPPKPPVTLPPTDTSGGGPSRQRDEYLALILAVLIGMTALAPIVIRMQRSQR